MRVPPEQRGPRELLHTVRLDGFGDRRPHELSGGSASACAGRALAQESQVLLMDEPFGAPTPSPRRLHDEVEGCGRSWITILFVTHNVREAVRLGTACSCSPVAGAGG